MGLRRFLHDYVGYRGDQKELHAMLCVIEAHVWEHPDEYEFVSFKNDDKRFGKHSYDWLALFNKKRGTVINQNRWHNPASVWIEQPTGWKRLVVSNAWIARLERLYEWHQWWRNDQKKKVEELKRKEFIRQQCGEAADIIARFRPRQVNYRNTTDVTDYGPFQAGLW